MIRLKLSEIPKELTEEIQKKLTKQFIDSGKKDSVWKVNYIEKAVKKLAFGKCCFSEIKLDTLSTYTEIEHFYPKDIYPSKVVEWGNLLPSSKKCNTSKGKIDIGKDVIVNPFEIDPKEHLYFENFRLYPKNGSILGKNTIEIVALNDRFHFANPRAEQTLKILDLIEAFYLDCIQDDTLRNLSDRKKSNRINKIKGYLSDINRKSTFSACIATAVVDTIYYKEIVSYLKANNFWDEELKSYEAEINFCYLGK